jgi:hypothetical protein
MSSKRSQAVSTLGSVAVLTAVLMTASASRAGTPVYKCIKDGQTVLTDRPCETNTPAVDQSAAGTAAVTVPSSTSPSPVGKWTGQMQYQGAENGQTLQAAHSVALLSVEFTADGKMTGASPGNGCKVLGVWSQGSPQTLIWLDATFDSCSYPSLNRRYHGSFILAKPDSSGQVQVLSSEWPRPGQGARTYDVKGTLHR